MTAPSNRALRIHGPLDVRLDDEPVPVRGEGDVLIEVSAVGLCGSDRHSYVDGAIGGTRPARPLVLGHEVAGRVVSEGEFFGRLVVIDPSIPCGRCPTCARGLSHLCPNVRFAGFDSTDGGLQRYIAWPAHRCVAVGEGVAEQDAPLLEVLGIALHAIDLAQLPRAARVGVFGCGPVGLVLIRALIAAGADVVVATDVLPHRVDAAVSSGARGGLVLTATDDDVPVRDLDCAFECAGEDAALDHAIEALGPGGRVLLVGIPNGTRSAHSASPARRKEIGLQWVRRMADGDLENAASLVGSGAVELGGLVSDVYDLEHGEDAFERLAGREGLKVVIEPSGPRSD